VSDPRLLTVAEAVGEIEAGSLSAAEWFDAYVETPDELGAYLWRPDAGAAAPAASRPARSAPTRAGRSASRRRSAASSG
jgi:hypothetical protein